MIHVPVDYLEYACQINGKMVQEILLEEELELEKPIKHWQKNLKAKSIFLKRGLVEFAKVKYSKICFIAMTVLIKKVGLQLRLQVIFNIF